MLFGNASLDFLIASPLGEEWNPSVDFTKISFQKGCLTFK